MANKMTKAQTTRALEILMEAVELNGKVFDSAKHWINYGIISFIIEDIKSQMNGGDESKEFVKLVYGSYEAYFEYKLKFYKDSVDEIRATVEEVA